ncbi:hypothetical protein [Thiohalorhabdus methylotrophus]|uniref:Uncharacterized protein n=1 Tax=Thiohalorhabdus methylotrophus TaxID=3242694 RepID=A0ABV4U0T6_9GAMM
MPAKHLTRAVLAVGLALLICGPRAVPAKELAGFPAEFTELPAEAYYDEAEAPSVEVDQTCLGEGENRTCYPAVKNGAGEVLRRFGTETTVSGRARARYRDRAFALVSHDCGDYCDTQYTLYDQGGKVADVAPGFQAHFLRKGNAATRLLDKVLLSEEQANRPVLLDLHISRQGQLLALTSEGLMPIGQDGRRLPGWKPKAPAPLTHGRIENDLDGRLGMIGVDRSGTVWLGHAAEGWSRSGVRLAKHGDRNGVLAAHPLADGTVVGAVYRYVSPSNKGVYLAQAGPGMEPPQNGALYLSTERNVGFDPEVFPRGEEAYLVLATDSTHGERVAITVPRKDLANLTTPTTGVFSEGERWTTLKVGGGIQRLNWEAHSEVSEGDRTFLNVDYRIEPSLLYSGQFQARFGETRLGLIYLKDQARDAAGGAGTAGREASEYLIGTLDFQSLFSRSSGLRIRFRRTATEGVAKVDRPDQAATTFQAFKVDYSQFGVYQTLERGWLWGLEYTTYQMPSAVGFSGPGKNIVYSAFDPEFGIQKLALAAGYDPMAYARRYETDYHQVYITGKLALGMGAADISSAVKSEARKETGLSKVRSQAFFAVDGMLEAGYLWQERFADAGGLGYQLVAGYQALGAYMGGSQSDKAEADGLYLEFSRSDLWHGPFARLNVIF